MSRLGETLREAKGARLFLALTIRWPTRQEAYTPFEWQKL
jgi:hypothetical protein